MGFVLFDKTFSRVALSRSFEMAVARAGIRDVARLAGVSVATVSKVFNPSRTTNIRMFVVRDGLNTFETVATETPASLATSLIPARATAISKLRLKATRENVLSNSTKPTFLNDKMDLFCFNYIANQIKCQ